MREITDEIQQEKQEAMTEEKKGDIFFTVLSGKTVQKTVSTLRGDFVIKFPKQNDLIAISRIMRLHAKRASGRKF